LAVAGVPIVVAVDERVQLELVGNVAVRLAGKQLGSGVVEKGSKCSGNVTKRGEANGILEEERRMHF
jgi:hypothetical protein